jgi:hypothetical protein
VARRLAAARGFDFERAGRAVTSNMAIVANQNDKTDVYASGLTQLLLDLSGYFAP